MRVILVLTLLLFVVEFIQCLKRTCVESASNKYVENLFKPLVAVQDRQYFEYIYFNIFNQSKYSLNE